MSLDLDNYFNTCYLAEMSFGTPPQKLLVLLDTGSSHTWVLSDQANTKGFETFYDKSKSSTFYDPLYGVRVGIQFGIGGLNGIFVQDRLTIGDHPQNSAVL
jgi:hypothetical protein